MTVLLRHVPQAGMDLTAEAEQHLDAVTDLYDNDDTYARRVALAACQRGDAAYWTRASYHSQRACQLKIAANQMPLRNALRSTYKPGSDWIAALDTLIPLNSQAAAALSGAYAEYGLWREEAELLARCVRGERGRRA